MRQFKGLLLVIPLTLLLSGCNKVLQNTHQFKAEVESESWSVHSEYQLTEHSFTTHTVIKNKGGENINNISYKWSYPNELEIGGEGTLSNQSGSNEFDTSFTSYGTGPDQKGLSFYKEYIDQTSIIISWGKESKQNEKVVLDVE